MPRPQLLLPSNDVAYEGQAAKNYEAINLRVAQNLHICGFMSKQDNLKGCNAKFRTNSDLARHEKGHLPTGAKPYACPSCPGRFSQVSHLKTHIAAKHTKAVGFACLCGFAKADQSQVSRHFKDKFKRPDGRSHDWAIYEGSAERRPRTSPRKKPAKVASPRSVTPVRFDSGIESEPHPGATGIDFDDYEAFSDLGPIAEFNSQFKQQYQAAAPNAPFEPNVGEMEAINQHLAETDVPNQHGLTEADLRTNQELMDEAWAFGRDNNPFGLNFNPDTGLRVGEDQFGVEVSFDQSFSNFGNLKSQIGVLDVNILMEPSGFV